jgi:hypothetical protein
LFNSLLQIFTLLFTVPIPASASPCDFLQTSPKVQQTLSSFNTEFQTASSWQNYRLSQNPVVLMELSQNQNCAVLILNGKIVSTLVSVKDLKLGNNVFTFIREGQNFGSDELGDIPAALEKQNIRSVLIWNLDFSWPPVVPTGFQLGIMAHEGFHLFVQGDKQIPWPTWPMAQGQFSGHAIRLEIMQKCYNGTSQIAKLADQEFQELTSAHRAIVAGDISGARSRIHDFVRSRVLRYDLLKSVKVTLSPSTAMSCEEIEASFEFHEGIPDYISYATSLKTKQIDLETLIAFLQDQYQPSKMKESYYALGGLQVLALSVLDPNFAELQQRLLSSKSSADGVFSKIQERIYSK